METPKETPALEDRVVGETTSVVDVKPGAVELLGPTESVVPPTEMTDSEEAVELLYSDVEAPATELSNEDETPRDVVDPGDRGVLLTSYQQWV